MRNHSVNVLVEHRDAFRDLCVNKTEYFRETGSNSNVLLSERENHFLHSAAGRFQHHGHRILHDAIMDILCVRIRDLDIVEQLLEAGYLEEDADEEAPLHILWAVEKMGKEDWVELSRE